LHGKPTLRVDFPYKKAYIFSSTQGRGYLKHQPPTKPTIHNHSTISHNPILHTPNNASQPSYLLPPLSSNTSQLFTYFPYLYQNLFNLQIFTNQTNALTLHLFHFLALLLCKSNQHNFLFEPKKVPPTTDYPEQFYPEKTAHFHFFAFTAYCWQNFSHLLL
jgi:hypothetical protein